MKKLIVILCVILAFAAGLMLYLYMGDTASQSSAGNVPAVPDISASHAILIDGGSGEVLYEKDAEGKAYPASTTKIMTAYTALEICRQYDIDITTELTVSKEAVGIEGSSIYLKAGEKKTIEELLYGLMLRSGNDAAEALAIGLGGNTAHFVELMNENAAKIGCKETRFVNPSGLYDEDHYTTAADLACIARKAMENETFRKIAGTKEWNSYVNKNKTITQYEGATGIKIGYTEKSGRTLVASSERMGVQMICVVLNDGNWFNDAYALMDYGFALKGVKDSE